VSLVPYALTRKRVLVAGDRGMVGSALCRRLATENCQLLTVARNDVDLTRQEATEAWFRKHRPDVVIVAAAKVGGIAANAAQPVDFLYDNLMIAANIIKAAHECHAEKLVFLGSSCVYPKFAPQPIAEDAILTGPLEPTNEWYAIAKIAGMKLVQACRQQYGDSFITVMPTNLYGPGDNFDLESSHVLPALIRKAHNAKIGGANELIVWGSGTPRREFLHVDDCADAIVHITKTYSGPRPVNIGSGEDIAILDAARLVCEVVGFKGAIKFDPAKPDGTPQKLLDTTTLRRLGWRPCWSLKDGIADVYSWFLSNFSSPAPVSHAMRQVELN
jgi:GDP-L-fucose synthase